ncbi:MAG: hypothetical protein JWM98_183 [Thermoleophilia bacterium]|nr:hypothetical protein [Thermoleophilia bacterium]
MRSALVRPLPTPRACAVLACALVAAALFATSGFGATSATQSPTANVVGTLSLTDPTATAADPPVCTAALAPLDTDHCADVSFAGGPTKVLRLGALSGSDVQAAALRWSVTTTNPTGYRVIMSNAGAAPLLRSGSTTIPDMPASPPVPASGVDDATQFGVAMGDAGSDGENAIPTAWETSTGQQGELFTGIPTAGMVVAERTTPQTNDPFTATFAAASVASAQPAPGAYAGTVRLVASAL